MSTPKYKEKRKRKLKSGSYKGTKRGRQIIRLPVSKERYESVIDSAEQFRLLLTEHYKLYEELFPKGLSLGYELHGKGYSKKLDFTYRRIILKSGVTYSILPCCIMPYMVGFADEVSTPLLFKKYGAPCWLLTHAFGHSDMYWERIEQGLGRNSIVGTTVKRASCLPQDYACDEKFSRWGRQRAYIAMTAAKECVLGMSITLSETAKAFGKAYGVFVKEARNVKTNFKVRSVNLDGFHSSRKAWKAMFKDIVVVLCFLHGVLKIKKAARYNQTLFDPLMDKVWGVYHSESSQEFLDNMEQLKEWTDFKVEDEKIKVQVMKLYNRSFEYDKAYSVKNCHRTSNMIDRQMDTFDRYIYNRKYYHGHLKTSELKVRAWAIMHNFAPFCSRKKLKLLNGQPLFCRAAQLNGFVYSDNWMENLICSASMNGFRA